MIVAGSARVAGRDRAGAFQMVCTCCTRLSSWKRRILCPTGGTISLESSYEAPCRPLCPGDRRFHHHPDGGGAGQADQRLCRLRSQLVSGRAGACGGGPLPQEAPQQALAGLPRSDREWRITPRSRTTTLPYGAGSHPLRVYGKAGARNFAPTTNMRSLGVRSISPPASGAT